MMAPLPRLSEVEAGCLQPTAACHWARLILMPYGYGPLAARSSGSTRSFRNIVTSSLVVTITFISTAFIYSNHYERSSSRKTQLWITESQRGASQRFYANRLKKKRWSISSLPFHKKRRLPSADIRDYLGCRHRVCTCAVVGGSDLLNRDAYGAAIDAHDIVIRSNSHPTGGTFLGAVGEKTSLRISDLHSAVVAKSEKRARVPYVVHAIPREDVYGDGEVMYVLSSAFVDMVHRLLLGKGRYGSAGFMGVVAATNICPGAPVGVYGFDFYTCPTRKNHYYDLKSACKPSRQSKRLHNWDYERKVCMALLCFSCAICAVSPLMPRNVLFILSFLFHVPFARLLQLLSIEGVCRPLLPIWSIRLERP